MQKNTREKLLEKAELLFAEKGFDGASIHDIAKELSLTKQGLLHHFAKKEKLYAAVLQRAADYLLIEIGSGQDENLPASEQLRIIIERLSTENERTLRVIVLLMRELLDNRQRAETAHKWFLRPFLDTLENLIRQAQQQGEFQGIHPLAFVYQVLGAIQYFAISLPTLKRLYSVRAFNDHKRHHFLELQRLFELARGRA